MFLYNFCTFLFLYVYNVIDYKNELRIQTGGAFLLDDDEIIELWNDDINKAMEVLEDQYYKLSWSIAGSILKDAGTRETIQDCIAESYIYVWKNFYKYDKSKASLKNWLCIIVKSKTIDYLRKSIREKTLFENYADIQLGGSDNNILDTVLVKENYEDVKKFIYTLKEPYKEIAIRRYIYELTPKEIAVTTGLPTKKINYYLYELKKKLKTIGKELHILNEI